MLKMLMAAPLGDADRDPGAPTTYVGDVDDAPLGGADGDSRAHNLYQRRQ
jgi:hypothetical protein